MYKKDDGQVSLLDFISPFGELNPRNRWVKKAAMIPWKEIEGQYAKLFCENNGAPAKPLRMALGALIIKEEMHLSDEETLQIITENPYMQYFIGLKEFTEEPPFTSSMMVHFRRRISAEMLSEINEMIFQQQHGVPKVPESDDEPKSGSNGGRSEGQSPKSGKVRKNEGKLMLDATCAPADMRHPTDTGLLNEAREKLEAIIDALYPLIEQSVKPRTYRNKAHKSYMRFARNRKPGNRLIRKVKRQQLGFVRRDLKHIEQMLEITGIEALSEKQRETLATIQIAFTQQELMYRKKEKSVPRRIVSLSKPFVRAIARGKARAPFEFPPGGLLLFLRNNSPCRGESEHFTDQGVCVLRQNRLGTIQRSMFAQRSCRSLSAALWALS